MPIANSDVKLYESQRMADTDDGGGRATGVEIVDGEVNNMFRDISRMDRTLGDVALRKSFVGIDTETQDAYLGAHVVFEKKPSDPRVHVIAFHAASEADTRADARNRIESYVVKGSAAGWKLLGTQYEGQRQIIGYQRLEMQVPAVGDVFCLLHNERNSQGQIISTTEQYVRITRVEYSTQTFTESTQNGFVDFQRRRLQLGLSARLEQNWPGSQPARNDTQADTATQVLETQVADASHYFGITQLAESGESTDTTIVVDDVYSPLVPSAQTEQPLIDLLALGGRAVLEACATSPVELSMPVSLVVGVPNYLPRGAQPGSVSMTVAGASYIDDGLGSLVRIDGPSSWPARYAIDYVTGLFTVAGTGASVSYAGSVRFIPAAARTGKLVSTATLVTLANRGFNWAFALASAKPKPATLIISYRVMGRWYDLIDNGLGQLEGYGGGSVSYTTGSVAATTAALPDVDSQILVSWVVDAANELALHTGTAVAAAPEFVLQLQPGVEPGELALEYTHNAATKTITDDGAGTLTGDGSGSINYALGIARVAPTHLPDAGTGFELAYKNGAVNNWTHTPIPDINGTIEGTIPDAPLLPGSISIAAETLLRGTSARIVTARDDGAGGFLGGFVGFVNYTTGEYQLQILQQETLVWDEFWKGPPILMQERSELVRRTLNGPVTVRSQPSSTAHDPLTATLSPGALQMQLVTGTLNPLLPGSLMFSFFGDTYIDRDGILYRNPSPTTGAATAVGTVDYASRQAVLQSWPAGASGPVNVLAAVTVEANVLTSTLMFRLPGSPVRPTSLQVTATPLSGGSPIVAQADGSGTIAADSVIGSINYETGVVDLWYTTDPDDDTGASNIYVWPDTIRYNAILFAFLPVDATLLGLDPVRLPGDGRVPIFREGGVVVLMHSADTDAGTPTDGQTVTLPRENLAAVAVTGANGLVLAADQYTADLLAGEVTFADPLSLVDDNGDPLTTPITITHRIEHMSAISDVQISGELGLVAPLTRTFPAAETVVSSALVWGDLFVAVQHFFTQRTWNSSNPNWTDQRIGDDTTANYNLIDNPVAVTNRGCITEKWALVFTGTTAFQIVGQQLGIIGTGSTAVDCAPVNPNTGLPYFTLKKEGWGSGWVSGNAVRFNTRGAMGPLWIARTTIPGQGTVDDDDFRILIRGDSE